MITPGSHIAIVSNYTLNLQTPIRALGGAILFIYFDFDFIYYPIECSNITSLNTLDKLLTILRIN